MQSFVIGLALLCALAIQGSAQKVRRDAERVRFTPVRAPPAITTFSLHRAPPPEPAPRTR
jgi:hypothetical protein